MQICMAAAVRGAAAGSRVAYLDTSNAVTLRRLMQLHAALPQVLLVGAPLNVPCRPNRDAGADPSN